jgi:hypothetical protein
MVALAGLVVAVPEVATLLMRLLGQRTQAAGAVVAKVLVIILWLAAGAVPVDYFTVYKLLRQGLTL